MMPWPNSGEPQIKIKTTVYRPDTTGKGTLIDLFV
jgi:hypothetical protein